MSIVYRPALNNFLKFAEKNYRHLNMLRFKLKNRGGKMTKVCYQHKRYNP